MSVCVTERQRHVCLMVCSKLTLQSSLCIATQPCGSYIQCCCLFASPLLMFASLLPVCLHKPPPCCCAQQHHHHHQLTNSLSVVRSGRWMASARRTQGSCAPPAKSPASGAPPSPSPTPQHPARPWTQAQRDSCRQTRSSAATRNRSWHGNREAARWSCRRPARHHHLPRHPRRRRHRRLRPRPLPPPRPHPRRRPLLPLRPPLGSRCLRLHTPEAVAATRTSFAGGWEQEGSVFVCVCG